MTSDMSPAVVASGCLCIASVEAEHRKAYIEKRLSRSKLVSSVLIQISSIKMMGLEPIVAKYLHDENAAEMTALLQERYWRMAVFALGERPNLQVTVRELM